MQHQLSRETSSVTNQYTRTLLLVVESGALYTSVLVRLYLNMEVVVLKLL